VKTKKKTAGRTLFDLLGSNEPAGSVHPPIPPQAFGSPMKPNPLRWASADDVAEELANQLDADRPSQDRIGRAIEFGVYLLKPYELAAMARLYIALVNADRESVD
jgi:hypothetical protein